MHIVSGKGIDEKARARLQNQKTVLFLPLNAAGHISSSLAIADQLRDDHGYRTIFVLVGPPLNDSIRNHGHELVVLDEFDVYEDYELEGDEHDAGEPDEELMKRKGKTKRPFLGAFKWPQVMARNQRQLEATPKEMFRWITSLRASLMAKALIMNTPMLEEAIDKIDPDIIINDTYFPVPTVLLEEDRRPWVRIHSANPLSLMKPKLVVRDGSNEKLVKPNSNFGFKLYTKEERLRMAQEEPQKWRAIVDEWAEMNQEVYEAFSGQYAEMREYYLERGCNQLGPGQMAVDSPHLNIYMFPEALDYDQDDDILEYPARWLRCDSLIGKPNGQLELSKLNHWKALLASKTGGQGKPVIFFSLGSIASGNLSLMRRYISILNDDTKDRLYVVSKGVNGDRFELNERNMIGGNYIPQTFFLQQANLAIIHGGNNSITECLYYGVPLIVLPNFSDQFDNAQRIEDLKLGKRLDLFKCSRDDLLGAVDGVLADQDLIQRVKSIGEQMRKRDEMSKLSNILSDLIDKKSLDEDMAKKYNIKLK